MALNKDALAAILATLQQQNEAIQQLLKAKTAQPTSNYKFDKFDPKEEEFSTYFERFENYLLIRGIVDVVPADPEQPSEEEEAQILQVNNSKKTLLLGCLLRSQFLDIKSELNEQSIVDTSYDELLEILRKRYDKKFNVQTERHRFLSCIQTKSESLADYIAALKLIGQKCKWFCPACEDSISDTIMQAQFIGGLADSNIRVKLLEMDSDMTFEQTVNLAEALEAARK